MASNFENPEKWRLTTSSGIKYKFLGVEGNVKRTTLRDEGSLKWSALIRSEDLTGFLTERFPPSTFQNLLPIPTYHSLPEYPGLYATDCSFKSHDTGLPIDPGSIDPTAPDKTYFPIVRVDVAYTPLAAASANPITFLEISGDTSGEFINSSAPNAKWKVAPDQADPGGEEPPPVDESSFVSEQNENPTIPVMVTVPMTQWTVKWNHIPQDFYKKHLVWRLRNLRGRINEKRMNILYGAPRGTILFLGHTQREQHQWRFAPGGSTISPPISITMRFLEKYVIWTDGTVKGHNDFWRPGKGWTRFTIDGVREPYNYGDMDIIFGPFSLLTSTDVSTQ